VRGERAKGGGDLRKELQPATLSGLGVTKTESSRWQALARLDDDAFEVRVAAMKRQYERNEYWVEGKWLWWERSKATVGKAIIERAISAHDRLQCRPKCS
jgi:hypothetical protein